ncbi:hypothetical protein TNCV_3780091 [Trichonephila clavipes]|nr:hypothetical protein TNCV_3780091 [Trichonephila clavipes]
MRVNDEILAHFYSHVRDCLDLEYPDHWIGYGGPVLWLLRSPNLTLFDFFPMGQSQETDVSRRSDFSQTDLVARLHAACNSVDTALL